MQKIFKKLVVIAMMSAPGLFNGNHEIKRTLGRLILALVKFCDFEIFRFSVYFNLANSWKISELEKMVSDVVFSDCDSTCVKLKRVTTCISILYLVNP